MLKLGVLTSGTGTNLQAIIDAIESGELNAEIKLVISNKKSMSLIRASNHGIKNLHISYKKFDSRVNFDRALQYALEQANIDIVVLAGFMKILSSEFVNAFKNKIINIHPSLLPSFPGVNAQDKAFDYGVKITGCTVHFVDEGLDSGPILMQRHLYIKEEWDKEQLKKNLLAIEHQTLIGALNIIANNQYKLSHREYRTIVTTHD